MNEDFDLNEYAYVCYSVNLYNQFKNNHIRYFIKGKNEVSNKTFWIYPKTEQVKKILTKWTDGVGK
jgi:hypothetical protein